MADSRKNSLDVKEHADTKEHVTNVQVDEAMLTEQLLEHYPLLRDKSPEEREAINKKVVKRLDWWFLPTVTAMLLMNYLDRINVSNARLAGMQEDLGMSDTQWSAGISMFYVGYIISQVPANVVLARGNPQILLPCCMLAWSAVTICMVALTSSWGFILCRFLVGVTEGPFIPAVSLMTSSWYTKHESPLRMAIWHAGNIVSNVISGLLAAAILTNMEGIKGLSAWQWFFLIEGAVSILVGLVSFYFLPKWPHNTPKYYFSAEELEMAQLRVRVSAGGQAEDDEGGRWSGVIMACKDPFTWLFSTMHFMVIISQSFKDFFPSIMDTFGFNEVNTYLLQAPPYVVAYIICVAVSWSAGRFQEYTYHTTASMILAIIGTVILISTLEQAPRYFSMFLLCTGPFIALNLQLSWETSVVPRPRTKRAALVAISNASSSVTHWFTPYFFLTSQEPRYQTGGGIILVGCGLSIISVFVIKWYCIKRNKELERRQEETGEYNDWRFIH